MSAPRDSPQQLSFPPLSSSSSSYKHQHQHQLHFQLHFSSNSSSNSPSYSAAPARSSSSSSLTPNFTAHSRLANISRHIAMASPSPSIFTATSVPQAPEDPLFGLMRAYKQDPSDKKVDLGIGAYRDNNAKPWILPVVKKADEILRNDPNLNHEYLPIAGLPEFTSAAQKLILGADSPAIKEKRAITLQTISGTGAVHLGGLFLSKFHPSKPPPTIYFSTPTWANHQQIFSNVHLRTAKYPYFSPTTMGLDITGMLDALRSAPRGSIIVLHACAHNPTGVDPTQDQWKQIAAVIREANHFPFFDCAYQGFASGDLHRDAWAIRYFVAQGFELCIAQSFAKNFGLYGERAGAFHFIAGPGPQAVESSAHIASQLAILQRSEISNPPAYGARIASLVLNDPQLFAEWESDLKTMSGRIIEMRRGLRERLEKKGTPGSWDHVTSQIGMFSFTGLSEAQVAQLREKWHIYMTKNGRISMAGLNGNNIDYFAEAVDSVVRETS
ncbi:aspartate aminotransferase [Blastomyces gilchristii SLH14081]|uniref:Aspartate aminotransferase n=1 Tax=Blastomyces gilchristii (strain SLH14081) TaxID=559298 RepID=A0A179UWL5_BLAGS|nr:aspartate aminotransferase [Blastomyces gilchristii SLH14081]OAT11477.1 aspartate aminotransferase [Blastomyces gilchristii SLH14081]